MVRGPLRVLIAGIGNVLRGDDGFGPAVVRVLESDSRLPPGVRCIEMGIGGVGLVHELMDGYDALVVVDAIDRAGKPGTLYRLEVEVPGASDVPSAELSGLANDMHQAVPGSTLVMARALGVLPAVVRIIGCQPAETEDLSLELSPVLREAVPRAVDAVLEFIESEIRNSTAEPS